MVKKFTKCPICGASVKTEKMSEHIRRAHTESLDSGEVTRRPLMTRAAMDMDACDELYDKAARFVEREKFKKAIKTLQKVPEEYPDIADVHALIAFAYTALERFDDALIYYEKAANAAPWEWSNWYNLASLYLMHRRVSKAKKCLDKMDEVGYPPDEKDAVNKLRKTIAEFIDLAMSDKPYLDAATYSELEDRFYTGIEYMDNKDWDRAIEEFKYIASIDERSEKAYGNLGISYIFKGEFDEAERCFNRALEIDPDYPPALRNISVLNSVRKNTAKNPDYLKKMENRLKRGYF